MLRKVKAKKRPTLGLPNQASKSRHEATPVLMRIPKKSHENICNLYFRIGLRVNKIYLLRQPTPTVRRERCSLTTPSLLNLPLLSKRGHSINANLCATTIRS